MRMCRLREELAKEKKWIINGMIRYEPNDRIENDISLTHWIG